MRVPEAFRVVESAAEAPKKSAWKPTPRDELIHQWVRLDGKSQGWVATTLNLSQGTVSRVVQRYEKWLAHTQPREQGRLDHDERLRAQRWLTYERNERILASCLRIAGEMEGFVDVSKSTIRRAGMVGDESDVRTEHATLDRSGVAARFLRLAFRVNMEQLKLVELEPLEALPPLAESEVDEVAVEAQEPAVPRSEVGDRRSEVGDQRSDVDLRVPVVGRSSTTVGGAAGGFAALDPSHPESSQPVNENCDQRCKGAHSAHERITSENGATTDIPGPYESNGRQKKTPDHARMTAEPPPKRPTRVFHGGMPSSFGRPSNRLTADAADSADEAERRGATDETPIKHGSA